MSLDPHAVLAVAKSLGIDLTPETGEAVAKSLAGPLAKVATFRVGFDVEPALYAVALEKGRAT